MEFAPADQLQAMGTTSFDEPPALFSSAVSGFHNQPVTSPHTITALPRHHDTDGMYLMEARQNALHFMASDHPSIKDPQTLPHFGLAEQYHIPSPPTSDHSISICKDSSLSGSQNEQQSQHGTSMERSFFVSILEARGSHQQNITEVVRIRKNTSVGSLVVSMVHRFAPSVLFETPSRVQLYHLHVLRFTLYIFRHLQTIYGQYTSVKMESVSTKGKILALLKERANYNDYRASAILQAIVDQQAKSCCEQKLLDGSSPKIIKLSFNDPGNHSYQNAVKCLRGYADPHQLSLEAGVEALCYSMRSELLESVEKVLAQSFLKLCKHHDTGVASRKLDLLLDEKIEELEKRCNSTNVEEQMDEYHGFVPRAWSDGNFLLNDQTVANAHISPQSTVYLLFECPYIHRALRETTYSETDGHRGFSIFVRHNPSLTLVRVNVHINTTVRKLKAQILPLCIKETDEEKEKLVEEQQKKLLASSDEMSNMDITKQEDEIAQASVSAKCAMLHHGRILFDEDTLIRSGVGTGDVVCLLDKIDTSDYVVDARYASDKWYKSQICSLRVHRSTVFDVQALLCQLRERIDCILHDPLNYEALHTAFKLMDTHHSNHLKPQEYVVSLQAFLRLVAKRLADSDNRKEIEKWLERDPSRTGHIVGLSFAQPCALPPSMHHINFHHFLRLLSDSLVEIMRAKQINLFFPLQSFDKPAWLKEHNHLTKENFRLMHTVFSAVQNSIQQETFDHPVPSELPVYQLCEFLDRAGIYGEARDALTNQQAKQHGSGHLDSHRHSTKSPIHEEEAAPETASAYVLLQFLQSEQARGAQEDHDSAINLQTGYTFTVRKLHDAATHQVLTALSRVLKNDIDEVQHHELSQSKHALQFVSAGLQACLKFFVAPFLIIGTNTVKIWSHVQDYSVRNIFLLLLTQLYLILAFMVISSSFYIPMSLAIVYQVYAAGSSQSQITLLECYIPLAITCLLVVYRVSDVVASQVMNEKDDQAKLLEEYEQAKLVCLEMRAAPIQIDYPASLSKTNVVKSNRVIQLSYALEKAIAQAEKQVDRNTATPVLRSSAQVVPLEQSVNESPMSMVSHPSKYFTFQNTAPLPAPLRNEIGFFKRERLRMSNVILGFRLSSADTEATDNISVSVSIVCFVLVVLLLLSPGVYRVHAGEPFWGHEWYDTYIAAGAWVSLLSQTEFLRGLARACQGYHAMTIRLQNCELAASAQAAFEHGLPFYLDLRVPQNLEYWLALREKAKSVNENWLAMFAGAAVLDAILTVLVIVRVLFYGQKFDLLNVVAIVYAVVYAIFIVTFLLIVVQANNELQVNHVNLMQRIRRVLSFDMCTGEEWAESLLHTTDNTDDEIVDTWNEASHFHAEDDAAEEVREIELALEKEENAHREGDYMQSKKEMRSPSVSRQHRGSELFSCPHGQPSVVECMTCTIQSHAASLHTNQNKRLHAVHGAVEKLHIMASKNDSIDVLSLKFEKYKLELKLIDTTLQYMETMDEPITLLGLVVDKRLLIQFLTVLATGAASALSSVLPA